MKSEDLLQAIGKVDDAFIEQTARKKTASYMRWISLAASLLLVVGLGILAFTQFRDSGEPRMSEPVESVDLSAYRIALITEGEIIHSSFDAASYDACRQFADEHQVDFSYYRSTVDSTDARVEATELAIAEGYNVIVLPGYTFGSTIVEVAPKHKDVKFIALDITKGDMLEYGVTLAGETYDYNPDNWNFEDYVDMSNVYCCNYREELAGFIAGYAAVQLGYTELGFVGAMQVPPVIRYGYGFVQGADAAAVRLGVDVEIKYGYSGLYFGDSDITNAMDRWYAEGTQAVFACGGSSYTSVAEAAMKVDGKVIGEGTDQSYLIDGMYGEGITLTSAMKEIGLSAYDILTDVIVNGAWDEYAGKIETLGVEEDATYLRLPLETTQWNEGFTQEEYLALLDKLTSGEISVSGDIETAPATTITVEYLDYIEG